MALFLSGKTLSLMASGVVLLVGVAAAAVWMFDRDPNISRDSSVVGAAGSSVADRMPPEPGRQLAQAPAAAPPAAPSLPQRTETITYDNWTVTCRDTIGGTAKKVCSAMLQIVDQKQKSVIFAWLIGRNAEGALLTVMQTPTGVLIQKGLELKVDNANVRRLNYSSCATESCEASAVMDDGFNKEMIAGQTATATVYAVNGQGVNFNIPLKGIDKAIASIGR
jgi:invasion protein IalB